jgi:alpha-beta hydrolase superfamily lysophospholipase
LQYKGIGRLRDTGISNMQTDAFELSAPDQHIVRGTHWQPVGNARGVIQIFHGLGEHHTRYSRFARHATGRGIAVVAHDHRGHGSFAADLGHFSDEGGWRHLIEDGLLVNDMIGDRYVGIPIVLLGHSMGSYVAQSFAMLHDYRLTGLVLSASTWPQKVKIIPGQFLARAEAWRFGIRGKSELLNRLGFGDFNKPFEPARTDLDWLSRDEAEVDAYIEDPLCGGLYSCGLWLDLMHGLRAIASDDKLLQIRHDLPILLTAGSDDPVGGERGMTELAMHYAKTGHTHVSVKIYPNGRHEMFNETNREDFSADVLAWVENQLPGVTGA